MRKNRTKSLSRIVERDGLRGEVPSRKYGIQDRVYDAYLKELDPRANMQVQLALASSGDVRFTEFLDRISSTKYKSISLASIAKACNIDLAEFQRWYGKANTQRAIALAQTGSVIITQDMIQDAKSKDLPCERCDDLGFVAAPPGLPDDTPGYKNIGLDQFVRTCPSCRGTRRVRIPGDTHARDRLLEMSGIIKKEKGVSIVQNFGTGDHSSAVQDLGDKMPMSTIEVDCEPVD